MVNKSSNRKVITVGVFDFFHLGHLNVLESAKEHGDYLIVAVHDDKLNTKGVEFLYNLEERMRFVASIKCVDKVVPYERVDELLSKIDFDVFAYGPDQNHQYFHGWNNGHAKAFLYLNRDSGRFFRDYHQSGFPLFPHW